MPHSRRPFLGVDTSSLRARLSGHADAARGARHSGPAREVCASPFRARAHARGVSRGGARGLASGARTLSPKFGGFADGLETLAFNNLARLKRVRGTPVQLIHGTLDEIVSIEDARLMHATCKAHHPLEPCWIEGGGHNDITAVDAEFVGEHSRAVRAFLQRLLASASKEGLSE